METLKNITKPLFLNFLKEINKTKIPYFASGGTMLGAVRHKGIIPWDTDCDIGICKEYLKSLFIWINSNNNFFLWVLPTKQETRGILKSYNDLYEHPKFKQCYNNRIKTFPELLSKINRSCYITSNNNIFGKEIGQNRTCCELEIFTFVKRIHPNSYWSRFLPNNYKRPGFYMYTSPLNNYLHGKEIIPKIFLNLTKTTFYDTNINIMKNSVVYCKHRYGKDCMTKKPTQQNKFKTGNNKIKDFSPL